MICGIKKVLFLIVLTGSFIIDAMYVECLIKINNFITDSSKQIPGVMQNNVEAKQVIPYYIEKLKDCIDTQNSGHFVQLRNILVEYEQYVNGGYPCEVDHVDNGKSKVDYFFKRIVHSFHQEHYPFDKLTFFCFHFIKRYEKANEDYKNLKEHLDKINQIYQKKYQNLECDLTKQYATQIDQFTKQLEKITTEKEEAIKKYNQQIIFNNTQKLEHEKEKTELLRIHTERINKLNEEIVNLTLELNSYKQQVERACCKTLEDHLEKTKSTSAFSYFTMCLLISNLYFAYKYYTK